MHSSIQFEGLQRNLGIRILNFGLGKNVHPSKYGFKDLKKFRNMKQGLANLQNILKY
jgi:hypothetical protein